MAIANSYTRSNARRLGYRSGFEHKVAVELGELNVEYQYETSDCVFNYFKPVSNGVVVDSGLEIVALKKGHKVVQVSKYTCDFMLTKGDGTPLYIETKGRFTAKDRSKHILLRKQFPDVDLRVLFESNGKATPKLSYMEWAAKNDIKAAVIVKQTKTRKGVYIPRIWLEECNTTFQS